MCDTQVLKASNGIWFAKNSDREPFEPQAVVKVDAVSRDRSRALRTTYLEIPQVPRRNAMILSKPCWIWGAEMGLNEHGLVIGNEAIFSRQRSLKPALLGMDLVRLALERASHARDAIDIIGTLLKTYGQGGPAGYTDKQFHYDSSFILADPQGAWVMETAGKQWAARPVAHFDAISNALSLKRDYSLSSDDVSGDFSRHDSQLLPFFAASHKRRALSHEALSSSARKQTPGFADITAQLRRHRQAQEDPLKGSNGDICMHATGPIRRSQTTGSLVVCLGAHGIRAMATGTASPCLSLFRPVDLKAGGHVLSNDHSRAPLWAAWQAVQRAALFDRDYRVRLREKVRQTENQLFQQWMAPQPDFAMLDEIAKSCSDDIITWPRPPLPRGVSSAARLWRQAPCL